jgi:RNA polymerase sigma-70 factor (ECF subfamily)
MTASANDLPNQNDEVGLVRRAIQGDEEAFSVLYNLYLDAIYRYIFVRIGSTNEAEDLTEDVFVRVWEALPKYQVSQHPFKSWLYRIAHNLVVDYHRKHKPVVLLEEEIQGEVDTTSLPEEIAEQHQMFNHLSKAIKLLGGEEQTVIILRFVEGLSHREIGEIIGKSEEASRVIQHRALAMLSKYLDLKL